MWTIVVWLLTWLTFQRSWFMPPICFRDHACALQMRHPYIDIVEKDWSAGIDFVVFYFVSTENLILDRAHYIDIWYLFFYFKPRVILTSLNFFSGISLSMDQVYLEIIWMLLGYKFFFYAYDQSTLYFFPKISKEMIFKSATNDSFSFSYAVECASLSCWRNWQSSQWEFLGNRHRVYLRNDMCIQFFGVLEQHWRVMWCLITPSLSWYCYCRFWMSSFV